MPITAHKLAHRNKLREAEQAAFAARSAYDLILVADCDHPLLLEHSYGYEDTLGSYAPNRGCTDYHCCCCGTKVCALEGAERASESIRKRTIHIPGSKLYGVRGKKPDEVLADIRRHVLSSAPSTVEAVRAYFASKEIEVPK